MLKVASHSLRRVGDWEHRPCLREFWEEVFLPSLVRGPVDCLALRRLAESFRGERGGWEDGEVGGWEERRFLGARRGRWMRLDLDLPAADVRSSIRAMLMTTPIGLASAEADP